MKKNSAEAIENSVDSAETVEKTQLGVAGKPQEPVDSQEPIEESSTEPDIMEVLLGEEPELEDTGKTVPEGQYLKAKAKVNTLKQELERMRGQITQQTAYQQPEPQAQPAPVSEMPNPDNYDQGVYDPKYVSELMTYQKAEITKAVQDQLIRQNQDMERNAYLLKYQERIDRALPIANHKIEELASKDDGFKTRLNSNLVQSALTQLPPEIVASMSESPNPDIILDYYTRQPERLIALTRCDIDEVLNLGSIMGKVTAIKGHRKTVSKPINPVKSGDTSKKLHPIKDYDKYDHSTVEGHKKWERDLEEINKRR